ncbi:MAG: MFS transporter [Bacteroidetes bacterium]|nr:MFS transporter [Bacteroidota bacterium]
MIISPILPEISASLSIPASLQGTLVTAYSLALSLFALIAGPISDKLGRRRILLVGSGFMMMALLAHGLVFDYTSMLLVRAVAGAAGGVLSGSTVAYVGDYFPYERRGWANGWVVSGIAFGQIVGIPIGKLLAEQFGFLWPFLMFAVVMAGAFFLVLWFVPQPEVRLDARKLTVASALARYRDLLRIAVVRNAIFTYFVMFAALGLYVIYLPTWLQTDVQVGPKSIAAVFAVGGLANVITSPWAGQLSDRIGRKPLVIASCIGFAVVMVSTTFITTGPVSAMLLFGSAMVMVALRLSPLQSLVSSLVTADRRGMLMSMTVGIGQLGIGIGSAVAGVIYATSRGYLSNTLLSAIAILVMAVMVAYLLPEPKDADA